MLRKSDSSIILSAIFLFLIGSGEAFTENEQEQEDLNYMDLSEEELRRLEAEYGLLDEEDEEMEDSLI